MADEKERLNDDELDSVAGGKHHHHHKTADDVPDAIMVNEQLETFHHNHCPDCGSKETTDRHFCIFDADNVYPGKECNKCGKRWLTGGHM
ncbi:MAG: hypothetical protein J6O55_05945 [Lachnospiraceae bacterium]|nr:hypothetical protein [Lachnospiraceae bacterium]